MVYLFIGQDAISRDIKLNKIKEEFLAGSVSAFNFDVLYGRELSLKQLQEKLLFLPFGTKVRLVVIRDAQALKADCKDFLVAYAHKKITDTVLIVEIDRFKPQYDFIKRVSAVSQVCRFKEDAPYDAFMLARQLATRNSAVSLKILKHLLKDGQRPELILGALRSAWEREHQADSRQARRFLRLLVECDVEIKTGRLKPAYALEKFIVSACAAPQSVRA